MVFVVVRFRLQDFTDADVQYRLPDCHPTTGTGTVIREDRRTLDLMMFTPDRPVGAFIGACLLKEIFQIKDKKRPKLQEGRQDWDIECWHWSVNNWGERLHRGDFITQRPVEDYHLPDGTPKKARVFVLERNCGHVKQIKNGDETITVQYFKE